MPKILNLRFLFCVSSLVLSLAGCGGGGGGDSASGSSSSSVNTSALISTTNTNVPTLSDNDFLLGSDVLGVIYRYNLVSSPFVELFSDPEDWGSRTAYRRPLEIVNNNVVTVTDDNQLVVLDGESGELIWRIDFGGGLDDTPLNTPSPPVCADSICYVMAASGNVAAIDVENMEIVWATDIFPGIEQFLDTYPLVVTRDRVIAGGFRSSTVFGDVEPRLIVLSRSTGEIEAVLPGGIPSMAGDLLLIRGAGILAYDFQTLQPVWSYDDASRVSDPAVAGDVIVVHTNDPTATSIIQNNLIIGISRLDGSLLWSIDGGPDQSFYSPTTDGRLIYTVKTVFCSAGCNIGDAMALNPADGSIVWINESVSPVSNNPPIVTDRVLFYDDVFRSFDFELGVTGVNPSNGELVYALEGGGPRAVESITLVNDGKAYRSTRYPTFIADF